MGEIPTGVLADLSAGTTETANLMEWLAADMSSLARVLATSSVPPALSRALTEAADMMHGRGVTIRLRIAGKAIARSLPAVSGSHFEQLASHRSDLVRQWACYAVNDPLIPSPLRERLERTLRFAADANMSVREAAWMAFRPYLAQNLGPGLNLLTSLVHSESANVRRFAIEVSRPRSVWGTHIGQLKRDPNQAGALVESTRRDPSRYVRLAVGNWLNDASKTRPDWVSDTCARWATETHPHTDFIIKRALRTISRGGEGSAGQLGIDIATNADYPQSHREESSC